MEQPLPIATSQVKPALLLQNVGKTTMTKMGNVQTPLRYSFMQTAKLKEKKWNFLLKNNWTHTFSNLPLKAKGKEIQYQVKEVGTVKGYTSTVDDSNKGNVVITNSRTPEVTEVAVKKIWDDADNKDGLRPEKITVRLLADGQEVAAKEITATDNWQASFTDLPVYKEGKKITYTITEDPVVGYTTTIDGFTVTNRHTPPTTPPTTPPSTPPSTPPTTPQQHLLQHRQASRKKPETPTTPRRKEKNSPINWWSCCIQVDHTRCTFSSFLHWLCSCVVNGKKNKIHTLKRQIS